MLRTASRLVQPFCTTHRLQPRRGDVRQTVRQIPLLPRPITEASFIALLSVATGIGADFRRSMVATAPREELLIGRRPVRNWTRRTIVGLFCAENYIGS